MGSSLVNRALVLRPQYPHLSATSYLVLLRMCGTALDRDQPHDDRPATPARHYFAGWKPLALMLGYKDPGDDEPLEPAAKKAVQRAVKDLTECALIDRADPETQSWFRHRVYRIKV